MAVQGSGKTKAQDLERIRANQQRSRDRKRAYIAELEENIRQLNEKLRQSEACEGASSSTSQIAEENYARKELLKALGIDEYAQQKFVRAFSKRSNARQAAGELQRGDDSSVMGQDPSPSQTKVGSAEDSPAAVSFNWEADGQFSDPQSGPSQDLSFNTASTSLQLLSPLTSSTNLLEPLVLSEHQGSGQRPSGSLDLLSFLQPSNLQALSSMSEAQQQSLWTPCLSKTGRQVNASSPEGVTGCSIAFSMLFANNARGYDIAEIDARLQNAYRQDATVAEGCSVLNKVLFQLLSEIS